jgi:hypothetical protein
MWNEEVQKTAVGTLAFTDKPTKEERQKKVLEEYSEPGTKENVRLRQELGEYAA